MFRSKVRPIVIPQYEHTRLAGMLAQEWGNEQFDCPSMNFDSFAAGVALHDWHYGFGDNLPILESTEAEWIAMTRRGLEIHHDDPITDIVMKLHLRRLCTYHHTPERVALIDAFDELVAARLPETGHGRAEFDWADRITRFCDNVAFRFSFEEVGSWTENVYTTVRDGGETAVTYQIQPNGQIIIDPWPFARPSITGLVMGYDAKNYPDILTPIVLPFQVTNE